MKLARKAGLYTHKNVQPEILAFANLVAAHKAEVITAEAYRCGHEVAAELRRLHEVNQELLETLEKLARLGNGERYGNSEGNVIARTAINKAEGEMK